jgi:sugar lactone lactonase YvrE
MKRSFIGEAAMNALLCFRVAGSGMKTTLAVTTAWFALSWVLLADPCTNREENLFVANYGNNTIDEINSFGTITVFASSGMDGPSGAGLAFDSAGNLYVSNYSYDKGGHGTIEKYSPSGVGTVFASGMTYPTGMAFNSAGILFLSQDGGNIFEYDTNGVAKFFFEWGPTPIGLAFDKNGNLFLAYQFGFEPHGGNITVVNTNKVHWTFASSGVDWPTGLAFDRNGNLYVANSGNGTIEEFDTNGVGTVFASGLNSPQGLAFDSVGNLYVADSGDGTIEKFDTNGVGTVFASGLDEPMSIAIQIPRLTFALLGGNPLTNECHTTFTDPGSVASEGETDLSSNIVVNGTVNAKVPGTYILTYTVTDAFCQSATAIRTVIVVEPTPPVINCPANILVNAVSPNGAFVSFVPTATDECPTVSLTSTPPSGSRFAIGDTTVTCTVADTVDNTNSCTFIVHVKGASAQLRDLTSVVEGLGLAAGVQKNIVHKLQAITRLVDKHHSAASCRRLQALVWQLEFNHRLTEWQAIQITTPALEIFSMLGCGWR